MIEGMEDQEDEDYPMYDVCNEEIFEACIDHEKDLACTQERR